ncbi:Endonuclease/exonuclease/phosphatase [Cyathus striatus]|nr:Endonuclease/exonuclease/phosphatase [Cyathus striatus]
MQQDEWIRTRAREETRKGRKRLRIRVGTFNVNGKLPSQDLSAWIQGILPPMKQGEAELIGRPPSIPPMQTISPLTNILRNPMESWTSRKPSPQDSPEPQELVPEPLDTSSDPDLFVLSFQEVDLSTEALIYSTSTMREDAWCTAVFAALGEKGVLYEKLTSKQLVGMLVIFVVKKSIKGCFGDVRTSVAGAGLLGVMGNKGGVAVRVTFTPPAPPQPEAEKSDDKQSNSDEEKKSLSAASDKPTSNSINPGPTTLTFVNAHLAAFDEMSDRRNADYHDLSRRLIFEASEEQKRQKRIEKGASNYYDDEDGPELIQGGVGVFESDAVFWMGDLNYRLDLADADIRNVLADTEWDGKYDTLLRFDQLKKAMINERAFSSFREFPISHAPSYRFSPGLLTDKLGYDVKRKPAWTDRILNMPSAACQVHQRTYTSHPQITMSDHRPVAADFDVDVDYYDKDFHEAAVQKLYRLVGHMEDSHDRPIVKVDDTFVEFGKVFYGRPVSREIKIENAGKTPCVFRFVPADTDIPIHPDWLRIEPLAGLLLPGETARITLSVLIDNPLAAVMNVRPKDLSGTLILHTVTGKDHFISISGEYQYTCFANKLSTLTRLPGPIRSLASPTDLRAKHRPISASREVMRLVNWLMSTSGNMDDLFLKSADENMMDTIRECLDTGADFPHNAQTADSEVSLAFAVTLLRLLDSLVDPVIPAALHSKCMQMTNRDEAMEILGVLPPTSVNVWISVSAFLHYICQTSEDNQHAQKLAEVFAPVIMRDDTDSATTTLPASPAGKRSLFSFSSVDHYMVLCGVVCMFLKVLGKKKKG